MDYLTTIVHVSAAITAMIILGASLASWIRNYAFPRGQVNGNRISSETHSCDDRFAA